jgi:hypothetical protein
MPRTSRARAPTLRERADLAEAGIGRLGDRRSQHDQRERGVIRAPDAERRRARPRPAVSRRRPR